MAQQKLRIKIKDLPKDILVSEEEKKKILGGAPGGSAYVNAAMHVPCPISPIFCKFPWLHK